ncbi:transglutaminase family protein [Roseomonas sp. 18066]|uniref:transglutaminase-like domain-containing protein n=1 Tax=Roseomonas sp. 18066 TaxID=2681412 RepID=UPI0013596D36|nr:transglutaminase domain-containing protein [Roseomonas sp. 18066]
MQRRALASLLAALPVALPVAGALARPAAAQTPAAPTLAPAPAGWRRFELTTRVTLPDGPGPAQLWLPLAQTAGGYQAGLDLRWDSAARGGVVQDARYGASLLKLDWAAEHAGPRSLELVQTVATRDRQGVATGLPATSAERAFWREPTESVPVDGIVKATAERITAGITEPRARLRALYDWVVDNTARNPETPGCGIGDVRGMLESGNLSGKCADINGLMTGLARAAGFPARDVYGIRAVPSAQFRTLGATSADVSKAQHCRAEAYLEGEGWFPLDPADVRKVVLDHKLAVDSPEIRALREKLFGHWEMNWVGFNSATDIVLPGALGQQKPNFAFLMYPCAFTPAGQPDCLDPSSFRYAITAREVIA